MIKAIKTEIKFANIWERDLDWYENGAVNKFILFAFQLPNTAIAMDSKRS